MASVTCAVLVKLLFRLTLLYPVYLFLIVPEKMLSRYSTKIRMMPFLCEHFVMPQPNKCTKNYSTAWLEFYFPNDDAGWHHRNMANQWDYRSICRTSVLGSCVKSYRECDSVSFLTLLRTKWKWTDVEATLGIKVSWEECAVTYSQFTKIMRKNDFDL